LITHIRTHINELLVRLEHGVLVPYRLHLVNALAGSQLVNGFLQADGSIRIPEALRPYMGGMTEIREK
jgi:hypothetical protein